MFKIISTVVFAVFFALAGYSTYQLGLGLYGIPLALLAMASVMWEVWIQPERDEAMRQEMLTGIGDWNFKAGRVGNLNDAKDAIDILNSRVEYVTEAYAALKAEHNGEEK
jgi:hypothetical protein